MADSQNTTGIKYCNSCKRSLAHDKFNKRSRTASGLSSQCRECRSAQSRAWRYSPAGRAYKDKRRKGHPPIEQPTDQTLKRCTVCLESLPLTHFGSQKAGKYGVTSWCKECQAAKHKEYRQRPGVKERELVRQREWQRANRGKCNGYARKYRSANWEKMKAANYRWRKANPDKWKAVHKRRYYKDVEATRARDRARRAQKWIDNPEQIKMWLRMANHRRKVRRYQAQGKCSKTQFLAKCDYHGWRCVYCHIELTLATVTLEHRQPLSRQGSNWPANIAPACGFCNSSKHNKTEIEFRNILKQTLNYVVVLR